MPFHIFRYFFLFEKLYTRVYILHTNDMIILRRRISFISGGCNVRLMFPRLWAPFGNATEVTNLPPLPKSHSGTCAVGRAPNPLYRQVRVFNRIRSRCCKKSFDVELRRVCTPSIFLIRHTRSDKPDYSIII